MGALKEEVMDISSKLTKVTAERDLLEKTVNRVQVGPKGVSFLKITFKDTFFSG